MDYHRTHRAPHRTSVDPWRRAALAPGRGQLWAIVPAPAAAACVSGREMRPVGVLRRQRRDAARREGRTGQHHCRQGRPRIVVIHRAGVLRQGEAPARYEPEAAHAEHAGGAPHTAEPPVAQGLLLRRPDRHLGGSRQRRAMDLRHRASRRGAHLRLRRDRSDGAPLQVEEVRGRPAEPRPDLVHAVHLQARWRHGSDADHGCGLRHGRGFFPGRGERQHGTRHLRAERQRR